MTTAILILLLVVLAWLALWASKKSAEAAYAYGYMQGEMGEPPNPHFSGKWQEELEQFHAKKKDGA